MASSCKVKSFYSHNDDYGTLASIVDSAMRLAMEANKPKNKNEKMNGGALASSFFSSLIELLKNESSVSQVTKDNIYYNTTFITTYDNPSGSATIKKYYDTAISQLIGDLSDYIKNCVSLKREGFKDLDLVKLESLFSIDESDLETRNSKNFLKLLGVREHHLKDHEITEVLNAEVEGGNMESNKSLDDLKYEELEKLIYYNNTGARRDRWFVFLSEILNHIVIDFHTGTVITDDRALNLSISRYLESLYSKLVNYLRTLPEFTDATFPNFMYTPGGNIVVGYNEAINAMLKVIASYMEDGSKEIQSIKGNLSKVLRDEYVNKVSKKSSPILDAINAYLNIKYFDSSLQEAVGRIVSLNKQYKNMPVSSSLHKYSFSRDAAHLIKSWNTADGRTSIQNTSKYSKLILSYLPLLHSGVDTNRAIDITPFTSAFTHLFGQINYLFNSYTDVSENSRDPERKLAYYMYKMHSNVPYYSAKITELIATDLSLQSKLKSVLKMTDNLINVIKSVYYDVFYFVKEDLDDAKNFEEFKGKSLKAIQLKHSYLSGSKRLSPKYSALFDIASLIDDCVQASYTLVEYTGSGTFKFSTRSPYYDRKFPEKFIARANKAIQNLSESGREALHDTCVISFLSLASLSNPTVKIKGFVDDNGNEFTLTLKYDTTKTKCGILTPQTFDVLADGNQSIEFFDNLGKLFGKGNTINESFVAKVLDKSNNEPDVHNFRHILRFLDLRLGTDFLSENGMLLFQIFRSRQLDANLSSDSSFYIKDLISYAVKALVVSDIYADYKTRGRGYRLKSFLKSKYNAFSSVFNTEEESKYFNRIENIYDLAFLPENTQWVLSLSQANVALYHDDASATSKNLSGNNDANYSTYQLGSLFNYLSTMYKEALAEADKLWMEKHQADIEAGKSIKLIELEDPRPVLATTPLLFTKHNHAIKRVVINSDIKTRKGEVKSIKELKESSLFYNAIMHNFWGSYCLDKTFIVQPTTYSDKTRFIQYVLQADYLFGADGDKTSRPNRTLANMSKEELAKMYFDTVGKAHKAQLDNVLTTLSKILGIPKDINIINQELNKLTLEALVAKALALGLAVELDTHYRTYKVNGEDRCKLNEALVYLATVTFADVRSTEKELQKLETNFVNDLVRTGTWFYVGYSDTSRKIRNNIGTSGDITALHNVASWIRGTSTDKTPVANAINALCEGKHDKIMAFLSEWVKGGKLIIAKDENNLPILSKLVKGKVKLNPLLEKFFYVESLTANNLRLSLTGSENGHPNKFGYNLGKELTAVGIDAKAFSEDLTLIKNSPTLIKQVAAKYNMTVEDIAAFVENRDDLDLTKLLTSTSKVAQQLAKNINSKIVSYAQGTLLKRNVIIPATLHPYKQGLLLGTASKIKVAFMEDVLCKAYNFSGLQKTYLSMDGSTWESPLQSRLENRSLQSLEVGSDKKSIGHFFSPETMTAGLMKHAAFEMSNLRMRMSMNSEIPLVLLFKRMHNERWHQIDPKTGELVWNTKVDGLSVPIDLTKTWAGVGKRALNPRKISFILELCENKDVYYADPTLVDEFDTEGHGIYHKIIGFGYDSDKKAYYTEEKLVTHDGFDYEDGESFKMYHYFDLDSNHILVKEADLETTDVSPYHTIDSIYEIWETFGGAYSATMNANNSAIVESEISNDITTNLVNLITFRKKDCDIYDETTHSYALPVKDMFIAYVTNSSAMKCGAKNINTADAWNSGQKLNYAIMSTEGLGVQLDSDHDVAEAELTEFSLVIAALEAGGLLHNRAKLVYLDLGKVANAASNLELDAVSKFLKDELIVNDLKAFLDELNKELMKVENAEQAQLVLLTLVDKYFVTRSNKDQVVKNLIDEISKAKYDKGSIWDTRKHLIETIGEKVANAFTNEKGIKNEIYDLVGRAIINSSRMGNDKADLSAEIMHTISRYFNKQHNHLDAKFHIPFSDPSIYGNILSTFVSQINNKSIKRKHPGSGTVMVPGYNIVQYFKLPDANGNMREYMFDDLLRKARLAIAMGEDLEFVSTGDPATDRKLLVLAYLQKLQESESLFCNADEFIPSEYVDLVMDNGVITLNLDDPKTYYKFVDKNWFSLENKEVQTALLLQYESIKAGLSTDKSLELALADPQLLERIKLLQPSMFLSDFMLLYTTSYRTRRNITKARNLAPTRVQWKYKHPVTGEVKTMNIFDMPAIKKAILANNPRVNIQAAFDLISKGLCIVEGIAEPVQIIPGSLINDCAEMISSDMHGSKFGTLSMSVAEILDKGVEAFKIRPEGIINSNAYDVAFTKVGGNHTYISFSKKVDGDVVPWEQGKLKRINDGKSINVVYLSNDGRPLFKVGRDIPRPEITYNPVENKYYKNGKMLSYKQAKNLVRGVDGTVYETVYFVNKVEHHEMVNYGSQTLPRTFETYHIDRDAIVLAFSFNRGTLAYNTKDYNKLSAKEKGDVNLFITNLLDDIYISENHCGLDLNRKLSIGAVKAIQYSIPRMNALGLDFKDNYLPIILDIIANASEAKIPEIKENLKKIREYNLQVRELRKQAAAEGKTLSTEEIDLQIPPIKTEDGDELETLVDLTLYNSDIVNNLESYYNLVAAERFASWKQSLYFTASRIPALTTQSFMLMRNVAYSGSEKNVCYVSHWQTW